MDRPKPKEESRIEGTGCCIATKPGPYPWTGFAARRSNLPSFVRAFVEPKNWSYFLLILGYFGVYLGLQNTQSNGPNTGHTLYYGVWGHYAGHFAGPGIGLLVCTTWLSSSWDICGSIVFTGESVDLLLSGSQTASDGSVVNSFHIW